MDESAKSQGETLPENAQQAKRPVGRPTKYDPAYCEQAHKLALLGLTNDELARFFEIEPSTFDLWLQKHEEFSGAVKSGRIDADANVAKSLYRRAIGYSHPDVDIRVIDGQIVQTELTKHYPPDERSARMWLTNRQRGRWVEKIETGITDKDGNDVKPADPMDAARKIAFALTLAAQLEKPDE